MPSTAVFPVDVIEFGQWLELRGRHLSKTQYMRIAKRFKNDPNEIYSKITGNEHSPKYRHHLLACLRVWAKFKKKPAILTPVEDIRLPPASPQDTREPFGFDEWIDIVHGVEDSGFPTPVKSVCAMVAKRGIRVGDCLRIRKKEIQDALKTGTLSFEAKGRKRLEFDTTIIKNNLRELANAKWSGKTQVWELVGKTQEGATRTIRRAFDQIADAFKLDPKEVYGHRFRHTYATYYLQEMTGDPEALFKLQQQMGWSNLATAENYLRRSRKKELNEVEKNLFAKRSSVQRKSRSPKI